MESYCVAKDAHNSGGTGTHSVQMQMSARHSAALYELLCYVHYYEHARGYESSSFAQSLFIYNKAMHVAYYTYVRVLHPALIRCQQTNAQCKQLNYNASYTFVRNERISLQMKPRLCGNAVFDIQFMWLPAAHSVPLKFETDKIVSTMSRHEFALPRASVLYTWKKAMSSSKSIGSDARISVKRNGHFCGKNGKWK